MLRKIISLILCFSFLFTQSSFAQGVAELNLGQYLGQMRNGLAVDKFRPLHLRCFSYDTATDKFELLLDKGEDKDIQDKQLQEKTKVLMEYFQIGLALPNDKFWVNLRPDAQDQIIDPELEKTDLGKMMLESDLQLKKDTAQWTSPQTKEGKEYWDKLYQKARELFGTEPANIPAITRPWIVPGEIIIREGESSAYIFKANLKVMLEEDYLKSQVAGYNFSDPRMKELNTYSTQLIRELIIPKLTKDVNTSKRYASLRQVFFSLILARWFKERFTSQRTENRKPKTEQANLIRLIDSRDLTGLISNQSWSKTYYFNEYRKSFEKGEYNLKEQVATPYGQVIRSYVSGGVFIMKPSDTGGSFLGASPLEYSPDRIDELTYPTGSIRIRGGWEGDKRSSVASPLDEKQIDEFLKSFDTFGEEIKSILDITLEEIKNFGIKLKDNKTILKEVKIEIRRRVDLFYRLANDNLSKLRGNITIARNNMHMLRGLMSIRISESEKLEDLKELERLISAMFPSFKKSFGLLRKNLEKIRSDIGSSDKLLLDKLQKFRDEFFRDEPENVYKEFAKMVQLYDTRLFAAFEKIDNAFRELNIEKGPSQKQEVVDSWEKASWVGDIFYGLYYARKSNPISVTTDSSTGTQNFLEKLEVNRFRDGGTTIVSLGKEEVLYYETRFRQEKYRVGKTETGEDAITILPKEGGILISTSDGTFKITRHGTGDGSTFTVEKVKEKGSSPLTQEEEKNITEKLKAKIEENLKNYQGRIEKIQKHSKEGGSDTVGSPLVENNSSFGGIDFRSMQMLIQPIGSFSNLNLSLPSLSSSALQRIDLDKELAALRNMVRSGMVPSGARVKEYLAAVFQKGRMAEKQDDLLVCLAEIYRLQEEEVLETSPELRESLVIVDTGRFVLLPNNQKASLN